MSTSTSNAPSVLASHTPEGGWRDSDQVALLKSDGRGPLVVATFLTEPDTWHIDGTPIDVETFQAWLSDYRIVAVNAPRRDADRQPLPTEVGAVIRASVHGVTGVLLELTPAGWVGALGIGAPAALQETSRISDWVRLHEDPATSR